MDDSDQRLIQTLIEAHHELTASNREMSKLMLRVHQNVSRVSERQEHLILANARFVNTTEEKIEKHDDRIDAIDLYTAGLKANIRLILWVVSFTGATGIAAAIAAIAKAVQ
jgi:hypothetical protein